VVQHPGIGGDHGLHAQHQLEQAVEHGRIEHVVMLLVMVVDGAAAQRKAQHKARDRRRPVRQEPEGEQLHAEQAHDEGHREAVSLELEDGALYGFVFFVNLVERHDHFSFL